MIIKAKAVKKKNEKIIPFYKLKLGSVFVIKESGDAYANWYKYMKVMDAGANSDYNAVNLTNGIFSFEKIESDTEVEEVKAILTVEENNI